MIKEIICPTNFLEAASNAVEYASRLSQVFKAELRLLTIYPLPPVETMVSGERIGERIMSASHVLEKTCAEVNKSFGISCSYDIGTTTESVQKAIAKKVREPNLIVMGTNGADEMYQFFFGTNTYQVIKKTKSPVLIIPESVVYGSIKKIVFAWDYSSKSKFSFSMLNDFISAYKPQVVFLHVSKHSSEISNEVFRALKDEILSEIGKKEVDVKFEQLFSNDIPGSINSYMNQSQADMLAITYYNRGLIRDLFHGKIAKRISETPEYPVFILHA